MNRVLAGEIEVNDGKLLADVSAIEPIPFVDQPMGSPPVRAATAGGPGS